MVIHLKHNILKDPDTILIIFLAVYFQMIGFLVMCIITVITSIVQAAIAGLAFLVWQILKAIIKTKCTIKSGKCDCGSDKIPIPCKWHSSIFQSSWNWELSILTISNTMVTHPNKINFKGYDCWWNCKEYITWCFIWLYVWKDFQLSWEKHYLLFLF